MFALWCVAVVLVGYLLGSISFAWLAGRAHGIDLRQHGSGNLGATNAGRVLGLRWFFIVFGADMGKGLAAVLAARAVVLYASGLEPAQAVWLPVAATLSVVLGHTFTCFHRFKGGKGVATSLGALAALVPFVALIGLGVWLVVWGLSRLLGASASVAVSPASLCAAASVPVTQLLWVEQPWASGMWPVSALLCLLAALVIGLHHKNIRALLKRKGLDVAPPAAAPKA